MTTLAQNSSSAGFGGWLHRAEAWLDRKGKTAWIVATIVAFILFWPLGLALLAYLIWSRKMSLTSRSTACCGRTRRKSHMSRPTGNTAFDAYKDETLRRLEEEQEKFEAFLQRLRDARDKAEFDQFMDERAKPSATDETDGDEKPA